MTEQAHEVHDLYAMPADAIQEPPQRFSKAIRQVGPGLILAASIVGTGELINTTGLGAKAGFTLLWLILLSCSSRCSCRSSWGVTRSSTARRPSRRSTPCPGLDWGRRGSAGLG